MSFLTQWNAVVTDGGIVNIIDDSHIELQCPQALSTCSVVTKQTVNFEEKGGTLFVKRGNAYIGIRLSPSPEATPHATGYNQLSVWIDQFWGIRTNMGGDNICFPDPKPGLNIERKLNIRFYRVDGVLWFEILVDDVSYRNEALPWYVFPDEKVLYVFIESVATGGYQGNTIRLGTSTAVAAPIQANSLVTVTATVDGVAANLPVKITWSDSITGAPITQEKGNTPVTFEVEANIPTSPHYDLTVTYQGRDQVQSFVADWNASYAFNFPFTTTSVNILPNPTVELGTDLPTNWMPFPDLAIVGYNLWEALGRPGGSTRNLAVTIQPNPSIEQWRGYAWETPEYVLDDPNSLLKRGITYRFRAWVRTDKCSVELFFGVWDTSGVWDNVASKFLTVKSEGVWTQTPWLEFTAPTASASMAVALGMRVGLNTLDAGAVSGTGRATDFELEITQAITTGTINVDTSPVKGTVYINGVSKGIAPISFVGPSGSYIITVGTMAGYITPAARTVSLVAGQILNEVITYVPQSVKHILSVNSNIIGIPFTARIGMNTMSYVTPFSGQAEEGQYEITMPVSVTVGSSVYNFQNWNDGITNPMKTINLLADTVLYATYALAPPINGILAIDTTPVKGEIFVNGGSWGTAPQTRSLPPGTYNVSFGPVLGYDPPASITVSVVSNTPTTVMGAYSPQQPTTGTLEVHIFDATGVEVATSFKILETGIMYNSPRTITLPAGPYRAYVDYYDVIGSATVVAGSNTVLNIHQTSIPQGTLSIDTTPVKGEIFVDNVSWGLAPASRLVATGLHAIRFGYVAGYTMPATRSVTVVADQESAVTGVYVAGEGFNKMWLIPIGLVAVGGLASMGGSQKKGAKKKKKK